MILSNAPAHLKDDCVEGQPCSWEGSTHKYCIRRCDASVVQVGVWKTRRRLQTGAEAIIRAVWFSCARKRGEYIDELASEGVVGCVRSHSPLSGVKLNIYYQLCLFSPIKKYSGVYISSSTAPSFFTRNDESYRFSYCRSCFLFNFFNFAVFVTICTISDFRWFSTRTCCLFSNFSRSACGKGE